jgi:hypothetical protein
MSILTESYIEGKVVDWAKEHGFLTPKVKFAERGWPDRLFISPNGHTVFIEFKQLGGQPDPLQWYRLMELKKRGIPAYCCDSIISAITILKAALEPARIPEESDPVATISRIGGPVPGSRSWKDQYLSSCPEDPKGKGYVSQDPDHSPAAVHIQGVAGRDKEVEGIPRADVEYTTWDEESSVPDSVYRHPPHKP